MPFGGGLLLIDPGNVSDLAGIAIIAVIYLLQRGRSKKAAASAE